MPTVAYRAIRSRRKFSQHPKVKVGMQGYLDDEAAPHLIKEFDKRVANWSAKSKVSFAAETAFGAKELLVTIIPVGDTQIYEYVNLGTSPHLIPKGGPGFLAFSLGYTPKTTPGGGYGGSGTSSGPAVMGIMQVRHPGTEPRKFAEFVRKENKGWFSSHSENAWRRILRGL